MKIFFWSLSKINEKSYCITLFSNRTPKENFFEPPPQKHTTLTPGQPLAVKCEAQVSAPVPNCIFASFSVRFSPTDLVLLYNN